MNKIQYRLFPSGQNRQKKQSVWMYFWQYGMYFECRINKNRTPSDWISLA